MTMGGGGADPGGGGGGDVVGGGGAVGGSGNYPNSGGFVNSGGQPPATGGGVVVGTGGEGAPPVNLFGDHPDRNKVQAGAVCDRLATIQCAAQDKCCFAPRTDYGTCWQDSFRICRTELYLDTITDNPATGFDPVAAEIAFTQFESLAINCDPGVTWFAASAEGLRTMLRGTRSSGDRCTPPIPIRLETAAGALASCNPSAPCLGHGTPPIWRCTAPSGAGGPCFSDLNCYDGLYCPQTDPAQFDLVCLARKPPGSPCSIGTECESLLCKNFTCAVLDQQTAFCL
jgi:hypothetical protein